MITVTITGEFDQDEMVMLTAFLRFLSDLHNGTRQYDVLIDDPDKTLGEAEAALREMMPDMPGRHTTFSRHRKQ